MNDANTDDDGSIACEPTISRRNLLSVLGLAGAASILGMSGTARAATCCDFSAVHLSENTGTDEMAMSLVGEFSTGKERTAFDLRPPSQLWGPSEFPAAAEYVVYGEGDGSSDYSRLDLGWHSYRQGMYSFHEEVGGTTPGRDMTFSIAHHGEGWNRESIRVLGDDGTVKMGNFAQTNSQTEIDHSSVDILSLHPPELSSSGTTNSHRLLFQGNYHDGTSNKTVDWRFENKVLDTSGTSTFSIQSQNAGNGYTERLTIDDNGVVTPGGGLNLDENPLTNLPKFSDDSNAPADSLYFDTTDGQVEYKESDGTIHNLG